MELMHGLSHDVVHSQSLPMGKLSYNDKLRMQMLREQGLCEKAIISSYRVEVEYC